MTILEAALQYEKKGMSIIPVSFDKKPLIKWEAYQKIRATPDIIRQWWEKYPKANIGIVTGPISNLLVIDCDTTAAIQRIQDLIPDSLSVPCETTPRGGMHFFFSHSEGFVNRARVLDGIDIRTSGGYVAVAPSVNGNGKHWEWITSILEVNPPEIAPGIKDILFNSLLLLYRETQKDALQSVTSVTKRNILFQDGNRDEDLFHLANCLVKGGMYRDEMQQVLEIFAQNCNPPFSLDIAQEKIKSAIQRAERKERNITEEVREWVSVTNGNFSVTNAYHCVTNRNIEDRAKIRVILNRLVEQGLIERVGNKDGIFRKKETEINEIDWEACDDTVVDVRWPFELDQYYLTLPKNIIIVAGSPDAGKTAFCLNFAMLNMEKHAIKYFSSEMGALELKVRLKKFGIPFYKWKQVKFIERSLNFADVIEPDGINIVDYIEVPEEAWKIATPINEIFRKLNKGICVIALQKPRGRDIARGGESTLDRPRLYLSMGNGQIKIVKCKNWAQEDKNPNGLSLEYKIVQGCKFIRSSDWSIAWNEVR
jgi:hypothetical protein